MNIDDVTRMVMDNGMIVLIQERHTAPVVAINIWVNTGYFNETDSLTGISHLLEHMFFKGTKKRKVGELREETRRLGGYLNGGTIYEYTHYYTVLPSKFVKEGLELQSDALWNTVIDSAELEREKKVVIEEVKRKLDNPDALAWEKLMELAFDHHLIRRWRMGSPEQIESWGKEDFENYYKNFYRPDNIILSIAGDINTDSVLEEVRRFYGDIKMEQTHKIQIPQETVQKELRYSQMKGDITQSYSKMGFHIPGKLKEDFFALDVLAHILGHGRSSRLSQSLIERKKLVSAVKSEAFGLKDVGFFIIEAELQSENFLEATVEIFREIERVKTKEISDYELTKAKNTIKSTYLSTIETAEGLSENLAFFESYGDYQWSEQYLEQVEKVTEDEIKRVASKYLILENASLLEYRPSKEFDDQMSTGRIKEAIAQDLKKKSDEDKKIELALIANYNYKVSSKSVQSSAKRDKLSCGATLITKENHSLPLLSVGFYFKGGRSNENKNNCGITRLTLTTSFKGTKNRNSSEIFNSLEMLGASVETDMEADYFGYKLKLLSESVEPALDIMADVIKNATFNPEELEKEKRILLSEIQKNKDKMQDYPIELFHQAIFPGHSYGLNSLGETEAVERLNETLIREWYDHHFSPENMVIVAVGDFDSSFLKQILEKRFKDFEKKKVSPQSLRLEKFKISTIDSEAKENMMVEIRMKAQTAQALGFVTCPYQNEDLYALKVLQAIASGGGGRFFDRLREKKGLAYTVYGVNDSWKQAGAFYAYIATSPENEKLAREKLLDEFYKFTQDLVEDDELETAKRYIAGRYQIQLETNSAQMDQYAKAELLGKGLEEVEKYPQRISQVTKVQVKDVATRYFDPKNLAAGVVRGVSH